MILGINCEECMKQCLRIKLTVTSTSPEWLRGYYWKRTSSSVKRQTHKKKIKNLSFVWKHRSEDVMRGCPETYAETARPKIGETLELAVLSTSWSLGHQLSREMNCLFIQGLKQAWSDLGQHALPMRWSWVSTIFLWNSANWWKVLRNHCEDSMLVAAKTGMDIICSTLTIRVASCWGWCWAM